MGFDNYKECKVCGEFFMQVGKRQICPKCLESEDKYFKLVRDYLYKYPSASVEEVEEQTDVSGVFIDDWIRSGRLENKGFGMSYPCDMCGRPIHVGKICMKCQEELGGLQSGMNKSKIQEGLDDEELKRNRGMYISEKKK